MIWLIVIPCAYYINFESTISFDCSYLSNLHIKLSCQDPPALPIQFQPFPLHKTPSFHPLLYSTWIGLKTFPIPIYSSRFEACLPQYVENSMMVLAGMVSPQWVELMKVRKEPNISSLLLFIFSTLLLSLVEAYRLLEYDSILLQTCGKF